MSDPQLERRCFAPTPDRLVFCLLAATAVLFLSERFQWFPLNHHKGWTVLVAAAGVGVFFLVAILWFATAVLFRLRFQFTVRSLLLLMVALALSIGWLTTDETAPSSGRRSRRQGSSMLFTTGSSQGTWTGNTAVAATPAWFRLLFRRSRLRACEETKVTDATLNRLKGLKRLYSLSLAKSEMNDAGLVRLKGWGNSSIWISAAPRSQTTR